MSIFGFRVVVIVFPLQETKKGRRRGKEGGRRRARCPYVRLSCRERRREAAGGGGERKSAAAAGGGGPAGMVFLLADWGMGDTDAQLTRANHHQALRLHQENRVEDDAEVALHPLANQVTPRNSPTTTNKNPKKIPNTPPPLPHILAQPPFKYLS